MNLVGKTPDILIANGFTGSGKSNLVDKVVNQAIQI